MYGEERSSVYLEGNQSSTMNEIMPADISQSLMEGTEEEEYKGM